MLPCLPSFPPVFWPKRALQLHVGDASCPTFRNIKFNGMTNGIFASGFCKVEPLTFVEQHHALMHIYSKKKLEMNLLEIDSLVTLTSKNRTKTTQSNLKMFSKVDPDRMTTTQRKRWSCTSIPQSKQCTRRTFHSRIRFIG